MAQNRKSFFLFIFFVTLIAILLPSQVIASPEASTSESGSLSMPAGCKVIGGDYSTAGTQKCQVDGLTGQSACYLAKIDCCGNRSLEGNLYDAVGDNSLIHSAESCEPAEEGCRSDCTMCSDAKVDANHGEDCDKGPVNGTLASNCTINCETPICGNGVKEHENTNPVEACDDGNSSNNDSCLNICVNARCGDTYVFTGQEQCDDGNSSNNDTCLNVCERARCGDTYVLTGHEECDDGNTNDADNCRNHCVNARCGDGVKTPTEECDDGNTNNADSCTNACTSARCGDGFVQNGEMCDGAAYAPAYQGKVASSCDAQCLAHYCGDGTLNAGEQCDDANQNDGDGCRNNCTVAYCGDGIVSAGEQCDGSAPAGYNCQGCTLVYVCYWYLCLSENWDHIDYKGYCNTCGGYYQVLTSTHPSPISLITYEDFTVEDLSPSRVKFELGPEQVDEETYWFASGETPLLIFDPENKGEVKDGKDLFGTWFKGKSWDSGYDALASLDSNGSGHIEGEELKGIRLWYDFNADAIVDSGEIQDLAWHGINKLNVKFDHRQANPYGVNYLLSETGFEGSKEGKDFSGQSFDWFVPADVKIPDGPQFDGYVKNGYKVVKWKEVPLKNFYNDFNGYLVYKIIEDKIEGWHFSAGQFTNMGIKHTPVAQMTLTSKKISKNNYELSFGTKRIHFTGKVTIQGEKLVASDLTINREHPAPSKDGKPNPKAVTKKWTFVED